MKLAASLVLPLSYFIKRIHWDFRLIPQKYQQISLYKLDQIVEQKILEMHHNPKDYEPESWDECDRYDVKIVHYDYIKDLDFVLLTDGTVCKSIQHQSRIKGMYDKTTGYFLEAPKTLPVNLEKEIRKYLERTFREFGDFELVIQEEAYQVVLMYRPLVFPVYETPSAITERITRVEEGFVVCNRLNREVFEEMAMTEYYCCQ